MADARPGGTEAPPWRVREECPEDEEAVRTVLEAAFGACGEVALVAALRRSCPQRLCLVAETPEGGVAGMVLFTPAHIQAPDGRQWQGMGLAPLAVHPRWQKQGAGSALVRAGLERLSATESRFVCVLGHPSYYPRFGFRASVLMDVDCAFPGVPAPAFMLLPLHEGALQGAAGTCHYRPEFDALI